MKTALITGANRGIGLRLVQDMLKRDYRVVATCRQPSPELQALQQGSGDAVELLTDIDVTSEAAVPRMQAAVGDRPLSLLLLNAGVMERTPLSPLDVEAVRRQFEVNALAPLRIASALHPAMAQGGKLVLITSRMGSIADNDSGGSYGYRMSKAALNAAGKSLAVDLKEAGIAVAILHPGWVKTDMTGQTGHVTAEESAAGLMTQVDALTLESSGSFVHMNGEPLPW